MSQIIINNLTTQTEDIDGIQSVSFNYLDKKIYSGSKIEKITGVFVSDIIVTTTYFLRWDNIEWNGTSTNKNIALFVRNGSTISETLTAQWYGPYYDSEFDISFFTNPYIQIMIVLVAETGINPIVNSLSAKFISAQSSVKFYTKLFDLGFSPKDILLTYNATENNDSVVRWAVSVQDTIDEDKYQFIDPNKIETLLNLSPLADSIKLMIDITGNSGLPIQIHEFAILLSGESDKQINKDAAESSSSTYSSQSLSTTSSSIDSSSSTSSSDSSTSSTSSSSMDSSSSSSNTSSSST